MQSVRGKADGPRDWVVNMDRDTKVRSAGHESMNVDQGASSTKRGTGAFEHIESSMWARLYCKRLTCWKRADASHGRNESLF
jgi:hypothetical protein